MDKARGQKWLLVDNAAEQMGDKKGWQKQWTKQGAKNDCSWTMPQSRK